MKLRSIEMLELIFFCNSRGCQIQLGRNGGLKVALVTKNASIR
jgi:hypothetical protein